MPSKDVRFPNKVGRLPNAAARYPLLSGNLPYPLPPAAFNTWLCPANSTSHEGTWYLEYRSQGWYTAWVYLWWQLHCLYKRDAKSNKGYSGSTVRCFVKYFNRAVPPEDSLITSTSASILFHTHISFSPRPCRSDISATERFKDTCSPFDILFLNHIIASHELSYSFAEEDVITMSATPLFFN